MKINEMFKLRYIQRNGLSVNALFSKENRKDYLKQIKQNPLKALYLTPLLLILPVLKNVYLNRHSKNVKNKIKAKPLKSLYLVPLYLMSKMLNSKSWDKCYPYLRLWCRRVDMPYFELVLTTRCTLRCESCYNLMQYFSPKNTYTCTFEGIKAALDSLFGVIDCVRNVRIIGGEPLLFKDIAKVVEYLDKESKVKSFNIVTNGTIKPKQDLLQALCKSHKCSVTISDYSLSPNIKIPLYYKEIIHTFKTHNIPYEMIWQEKEARWNQPDKIYKRGRNKEGIIKNFKSCLMPCVSVMSNENLPESKTGGGITHRLNSKGQIFICPIASSLSRLKGLDEFEGDFVELDSTLNKEKILNFYAQDCFKACDYCRNMWENTKTTPIAIQTDRVLKLEKDE